MKEDKNLKKSVWQNIYRLISPYKKKFLGVFVISLLSTGVALISPLIYREAVNDIAGLFVQQARNEVKEELGEDLEIDEGPISNFLEKELNKLNATDDSLAEDSSVGVDTLNEIAPSADTLTENTSASSKIRTKEPHQKNRVAPRTVHEAFLTLIWAVVLLFIINIIGLILLTISDNMNIRLSSNIERNFIHNTFKHVLGLPLSFFSKRSSAVLKDQIDQSEQVSEIINAFSKEVFSEIISLIGVLTIMFLQNTTLTLLAISMIPFYVIIAIRSTKKLEMSLAGYYEKWEGVSARMQDALSGIKTVKLSGAEEREIKHLDYEAKNAYADYTNRAVLANKYYFWEVFLTHISTALMLGYGGYMALRHKFTPGDVVMFVAYLDMLYNPIDNLASIWGSVQQNVASIARAFKLLDANVEEQHGNKLNLIKGQIEFRNVYFSYSPEREVLKGLSFKAESGKVTAIVGTSGAGKTTAVDLLLKLFEPQKGEILIEGQRLSELDGPSIRSAIGMISADGAIFRGTLSNNIRYKKPKATDKEVHDAAIAAGMQNTLNRLEKGLMTPIGENGVGLSAGERQRVQIARVIVSKPAILIMDEATANLDYATEAEIKKTIDEIRVNNTVIIIAHRYSMVKNADYIFVFDDGKVLEEGRPEELVQKGGWFTNFADSAGENNKRSK